MPRGTLKARAVSIIDTPCCFRYASYHATTSFWNLTGYRRVCDFSATGGRTGGAGADDVGGVKALGSPEAGTIGAGGGIERPSVALGVGKEFM